MFIHAATSCRPARWLAVTHTRTHTHKCMQVQEKTNTYTSGPSIIVDRGGRCRFMCVLWQRVNNKSCSYCLTTARTSTACTTSFITAFTVLTPTQPSSLITIHPPTSTSPPHSLRWTLYTVSGLLLFHSNLTGTCGFINYGWNVKQRRSWITAAAAARQSNCCSSKPLDPYTHTHINWVT